MQVNGHIIVFKKTIFLNLTHYLVKQGHKKNALKIFNSLFIQLSKKLKVSIVFILYKLYACLYSFIEIRHTFTRRNKHFVPFLLRFKSRTYLIAKWLLLSISKNNQLISIKKKFYIELFNFITNSKSCTLLKLYRRNSFRILKSKSNFNFTW